MPKRLQLSPSVTNVERGSELGVSRNMGYPPIDLAGGWETWNRVIESYLAYQ